MLHTGTCSLNLNPTFFGDTLYIHKYIYIFGIWQKSMEITSSAFYVLDTYNIDDHTLSLGFSISSQLMVLCSPETQ